MKFKNRKKFMVILYYIVGFTIFITSWYLFVIILQLITKGSRVVPYPHEAFKSFFLLLYNPIDGQTLITHVTASLIRVFIGVFYAWIIAVPLGIVLALTSFLDRIFQPIIEMIRPIPPIAWIPFAIITFGLTTTSNAFIIFIGAFFPLFQNVYDGVRQSSVVYQDVARSLGAKKIQVIWDVIIPSITPNMLTGTKIAVGVGWMCVIAAEMMGISGAGIGYFINYMKNIGYYSYMVAGMLMIALVGLLINGVFFLIEKYSLAWKYNSEN
ncbi:ABC transporter permease [Candidatus Harpocratesius sp.]